MFGTLVLVAEARQPQKEVGIHDLSVSFGLWLAKLVANLFWLVVVERHNDGVVLAPFSRVGHGITHCQGSSWQIIVGTSPSLLVGFFNDGKKWLVAQLSTEIRHIATHQNETAGRLGMAKKVSTNLPITLSRPSRLSRQTLVDMAISCKNY